MVSIASIMSMCLTLIICFGIPLILLWIIRRQYRVSFKSFFIGMIVFIVSTQVLEAFGHVYFLKLNRATSNWLENPILYVLYGGLMAGIFEETGRYLTFKWFLKKENRIQESISYGIGHGGIEAMLIVGTTYISNLVISLLINQGMVGQLGVIAEGEASIITQLTQLPPIIFSLAGYERLMTMLIQIGLSVLVFKAVREKTVYYYIGAVLLHTLLDIPAVLVQLGIFNVWGCEGIITLFALGFLIFIIKQLKTYPNDLVVLDN